MRIRPYTPADLDALRQLHAAQGFGYPFPDLGSPLFITKLVLEEDENASGFPEAGSSGTDFSLSAFAKGRELVAGSDEHNASRDAAGEEAAAGEAHGREAAHVRANSPRIVMAVLLRLTAEAYLLHDASAGTPRRRWQNLLALHEAARGDAAARGLDDVQAFLPPRVARAFGRRLARLGWRQDPWPCFSRLTEES